ncbi:MAG TPA: hypothetical protein VIF15_14500, partial [Polyangiaceae bacterium]
MAALLVVSTAAAQYPPPQPQPQPQPYPPPQPQPYPPQPYPPQPYPPQPQQYPQPYPPPAPQPYPPQPYPPQPYPPQPYPAPYGQPVPAPYPQPGPVPQPPPPPPNRFRSPGEMAYLYGVGIAYGAGSGIWLDSITHINDPGLEFIPPLALAAAIPVGTYIWDLNSEFDRGVPSTMATGLLLGGLEGMAVSGLQWQLTGGVNGNSQQWAFPTWSTLTFLGATGGGVGGYFFGEWLQPDPRSLTFIASGAGFGSIFGILFGAGVAGDSNSVAAGSAVWGFAGYNAGIAATGALS